jgi:AraC-like DNA-binding protein
MSRVETLTAVAEQSALGPLLHRWPVVCQVDGERALPDLVEQALFPSCLLVIDGSIDVRLSSSVTEPLEAGDLVVIHEPDGVALTEPTHEALSARSNWRIDQPHGAASVLVIRLDCVGTQFSPGLMPKPFVVRGNRGIDRALRAAVIEAARSNVPRAVLNAAASAVYLNCIHDHLATRPREVLMLGGLFDSEIGPVVAALMESPARDWTVESLADVGGMSRSAFARKFRDLMGVAPIDFLVEIRMWQAARALKKQSRDLKSIALEAGYQSPAAFSVAFKRWSGETPSDYRRGT